MKITLRRLTLKHFKGIEAFDFNPDGQNATISGPNECGKSTVADAVSWLLFGKNQAGNSSFSVKTLDADGQEQHNLEHQVEAVLEVNGVAVKLRKLMVESYVVKRGKKEDGAKFQGHVITYYVDDVPKKEGEFKAYVAGLGREEVLRMLTSVTYFNAQKWSDRRKIVLEVVGDISDIDVIATDDRFAALTGIIGNRTFDDTVKMLKAQRPKVNDDLDKIPARIDEATRSKPGDKECMAPQGIPSFQELTAKLQNLQNGRAALLAGDTSDVQQRIAAKKSEIEDAALKHRKAVMDSEEHRRKIIGEVYKCRQQMEDLIIKCARREDDRTQLENENKQLRSDFGCVTKGESICTSCALWQAADDTGRAAAPGDAAANVVMAEKQKSIRDKGKANNARIEQINQAIKEDEAKCDSLRQTKEEFEAQAEAIKNPEGPNMAGLQAELAALTLKLTSIGTPDTAAIDTEIEQVKIDLNKHNHAALNNRQAGQIEQRITELKADQKRLGSE
ncbi:MAG: AAA family ATPase, partial [Anaerolineales bacterium]|nr:AAA family ATPase [Anaerolineales bacterium]